MRMYKNCATHLCNQFISAGLITQFCSLTPPLSSALASRCRRYMKTSSDFLTSGRSIPTWVTGLAFMAANLGALELVGMAANTTKYGIATAHFYWVGAIPAMVFLAVFMMPFYYGSKARSVPEYLNMRFDERVRCAELNCVRGDDGVLPPVFPWIAWPGCCTCCSAGTTI